MMKFIIQFYSLFAFLFLVKTGNCQQITVYYTGVNGRFTTEVQADTRKEIFFRSPSKLEIITSRWMEKTWQVIQDEYISLERENTSRIVNK